MGRADRRAVAEAPGLSVFGGPGSKNGLIQAWDRSIHRVRSCAGCSVAQAPRFDRLSADPPSFHHGSKHRNWDSPRPRPWRLGQRARDVPGPVITEPPWRVRQRCPIRARSLQRHDQRAGNLRASARGDRALAFGARSRIFLRMGSRMRLQTRAGQRRRSSSASGPPGSDWLQDARARPQRQAHRPSASCANQDPANGSPRGAARYRRPSLRAPCLAPRSTPALPPVAPSRETSILRSILSRFDGRTHTQLQSSRSRSAWR